MLVGNNAFIQPCEIHGKIHKNIYLVQVKAGANTGVCRKAIVASILTQYCQNLAFLD